MSKLEDLERQVRDLAPSEFEAFRDWFLDFDWAVWDRQIDEDSRSGKLDALATKALRDHADRRTTPI